MTHPPEEHSPLVVTRDTTASRQQVWEVIADGWTYSQWVVGNSRMRAVDPSWPAPGSTIHHSIGVWPALLNDETVVVDSEPPHELVLLAKSRPFGSARITLRLTAIDGGCRIEMSEVPISPPLKWLPRWASLAAAWPRNRECTWRLTALAERRKPSEVHD
ncbi:MAG: hypothetical protein QOH60_4068 [Mycobacterium sp.]|jgi:uncharacterized protein YndB with AHSA1/START domain|nr:hypothetical protein [Mycobacterium sp.]